MSKNDPVADQLARQRKETEEQLARSENTQPTPTQEENDRVRLGVDSLEELDNKEADGGETEAERNARVAEDKRKADEAAAAATSARVAAAGAASSSDSSSRTSSSPAKK